jgi:peptidoglycan/xylan/chitin deacetylase (PgdA/CDA1 family)
VFSQAYPILKQHQIPFTFYVSTDMPDGKADLWWYQLEQLAQGDNDWFDKIWSQIYERKEPIAVAMHAITSSIPDFDLCRRLSITWDQLREMVFEGLCTVGSHGVTHSALTLMSEEQARYELSKSKLRFEEMLGVEVSHFSYPHSFYSEATNQLVWEAGYNTAVIGYGGMTRRKCGNSLFYRNYIVQP